MCRYSSCKQFLERLELKELTEFVDLIVTSEQVPKVTLEIRSEVIEDACNTLKKLKQNNKKIQQAEYVAAEKHFTELENHMEIMQKLDHLKQSASGTKYYLEIVNSGGETEKVRTNGLMKQSFLIHFLSISSVHLQSLTDM